jgi:hypothetical protein
MSRVKTQQLRVSARCTDSGPSTFLKDYLVICGRASACPMESASATLEYNLDSSNHIITQILCPVQRIPDAGVPAIGKFCPPIRVLSAKA